MIGSDPVLIQEFIKVISSDESVLELSRIIEGRTYCSDITSGWVVEDILEALKRRISPAANMRDAQLPV
jgi:hypothetical protein